MKRPRFRFPASLLNKVMWVCVGAVSCTPIDRTSPFLHEETIDPSINYCARGMAARAGLQDSAGEGVGEEDLRKGLIQNPNDAPCRFAYGRTLTSAGLVNDARRELLRVIAESDALRSDAERFLEFRLPPLDIPEKAVELNAAGWRALFRKNDVDRAIPLFEEAIGLEPRFTWPWNNLAIAYHQKKEYAKAVEMAQRAIGIAPRYRNAYITMGDIFIDLENWKSDEALMAWGKVLEIEPDNLNAKRNIAWVLIEKPTDTTSDWQRARDLLEQVLAKDPQYPSTNKLFALTSAKLHLDSGNVIEAEKYAQKAVALDPDDARLWEMLGQAYEGQGRLEEALKAYDTGLSISEYARLRQKREAVQQRMALAQQGH